MRCHYEVLNVSVDVNDEDLKKAYRVQALKWHPDKNLNNLEEAKKEFQVIQQAYSVLNDPQERAFYDRHKDSIIRGANSDYKENKLDVFAYFCNNCFESYDDSKKGFYTVYRNVFENIAEEESEFSSDIYPTFGYSTSSFEDVQYFYNYWSSFTTKKIYSWMDVNDITTAGNRKIARLMEQENKKLREKYRKERSSEIRALVQFVHKRDKRVQSHALFLKRKSEENKRKAEENRQKMILRHKKDIENSKSFLTQQFSTYEDDLKKLESVIDTDSSDSLDDSSIFCIACNKYFQSDKSFVNHQQSKKHKYNVLIITNDVLNEDALLQEINLQYGGEIDLDENKSYTYQNCDILNEQIDKRDANNVDEPVASISESNHNLHCAICDQHFKSKEALASHTNSKKHKNILKRVNKYKNTNTEEPNISDDSQSCKEFVESPNHDEETKNHETSTLDLHVMDDKLNDIMSELENISTSKRRKKKMEKKNLILSVDKKVAINKNNLETARGKCVTNEKQSVQDDINKHQTSLNKNNHTCATCNKTFNSKNKLYGHLKSEGHAVLLTSANMK